MGILLQAAYRGTTGSVPTPADGHPGVPWWWDRLAAAAHDLRTSGFAAVLLPRCSRRRPGPRPIPTGTRCPTSATAATTSATAIGVSTEARETCGSRRTDDLTEAGDWMTRALDVQGYRVDDVKGPAVQFVDHWLTTKSMATRFGVGEYFEGDPRTLHWWVWDSGKRCRCAAFDFSLRFALAAMCADPSNWDMRQLDHAGLTGISPQQSFAFIENPDTDGSSPVVTNKLPAYAYLLTAEGYSCTLAVTYTSTQHLGDP